MGENFTLNRYIALSISLAVLPAIFEELFFRGILLNSLISGGKLFAVIVSSLCFAVYHCSITQLLYQFIFGIAFSLLALNSKSIFPCILTHFLNNFIILTAYYFKIENVEFPRHEQSHILCSLKNFSLHASPKGKSIVIKSPVGPSFFLIKIVFFPFIVK